MKYSERKVTFVVPLSVRTGGWANYFITGSREELPSRLRCISHFLASCHKGGLKVTGLAATWRCVLFVRIHTKRPTISDALQGRTSQGRVLTKTPAFHPYLFQTHESWKVLEAGQTNPIHTKLLQFDEVWRQTLDGAPTPAVVKD